MARLIYTVWWILTIADGVGALCVTIRLWPERKYSPFIRYSIWMFLGLAVESFASVLVALFSPPTTAQISHVRITVALLGRSVKAAVEWRFFIYLLMGRGGTPVTTDKDKPKPPAPSAPEPVPPVEPQDDPPPTNPGDVPGPGKKP